MPTAGEYKHEPSGIPCHCHVKRRPYRHTNDTCVQHDHVNPKKVTFDPILRVRSFECYVEETLELPTDSAPKPVYAKEVKPTYTDLSLPEENVSASLDCAKTHNSRLLNKGPSTDDSQDSYSFSDEFECKRATNHSHMQRSADRAPSSRQLDVKKVAAVSVCRSYSDSRDWFIKGDFSDVDMLSSQDEEESDYDAYVDEWSASNRKTEIPMYMAANSSSVPNGNKCCPTVPTLGSGFSSSFYKEFGNEIHTPSDSTRCTNPQCTNPYCTTVHSKSILRKLYNSSFASVSSKNKNQIEECRKGCKFTMDFLLSKMYSTIRNIYHADILRVMSVAMFFIGCLLLVALISICFFPYTDTGK